MYKWNRDNKKVFRVYKNEQIRAWVIIIVDSKWWKIWTFSRDEAMNMAIEKWLDLVQVHYDPDKRIATAKMIDYWKYLYNKQKEEKEKKKNKKSKWLKEIKIWYNIWENDLKMKLEKVKELLDLWYNIKFSIRLRWREKIYRDIAEKKIIWVVESLQDYCRVQYKTPKKESNWYSIILFAKNK